MPEETRGDTDLRAVGHDRLLCLATAVGVDNVELQSMPGEESGFLADFGDAAFADAPATDGNRDRILCARIDRDNGKKHDAQYSAL